MDEQGGGCPGCGRALQDGFHYDHIWPQARGGPSTLINLQLLCPPCNMAKSDKDPLEWECPEIFAALVSSGALTVFHL